jgi:hypothetical protein
MTPGGADPAPTRDGPGREFLTRQRFALSSPDLGMNSSQSVEGCVNNTGVVIHM